VLRTVFFDLDDTLVDHRSAAARAVAWWAAEHGIGGDDVAARWEAICEPAFERYRRREITFLDHRRVRVREFLGRDLPDNEADQVFAGYLERYEQAWAPFADAASVLRRARRAGLSIAVLTNGEESQQMAKVQRCGLAPEIDLVIASSSLPASKPDPRAFAVALERARVLPGQALMVGDSLERDVRPALRAGMAAVLLDRDAAHVNVDVDRIASLDQMRFRASGEMRLDIA
jgi:putative hydrolase of the HAD superfamily